MVLEAGITRASEVPRLTRLISLGMLTFLSGCATRTARLPAPSPGGSPNSDYIDIQAGWRLTAVTPILKSGGYVLKSLDQQASSDSDFIGYEVAHYDVQGKQGGRVRVEFSSAEVTRDGKTESQLQPIAPLFQLERRPNYLRLIYLIRVSQADHNMAVATASRMDALEAITRAVEANPAEGCKVQRDASCWWIPDGIAVRPEALRTVNGVEKWVDAPR
jgi:hypothetical protein